MSSEPGPRSTWRGGRSMTGAQALAQVWLGGGSFRVAHVDLPELQDGELLVALSVATICGSDRHTVTGRRPGPYPSILGHEGVGTVVATRRAGLGIGDRVVFSVTDTCGRCDRCRSGLSAKCVSVRKVGHEPFGDNWMLNGTYATHIHIQAGQAVAQIPEHIGLEAAATAGCSIATVMAVMEKAGDLVGRSVLINGLGMLGLTAVVAARAAGADRVIASDPDPRARSLVAGLAHEVMDSVKPGAMVDIALELSGARAGVLSTLAALDIGGTAVLAGSVAPTHRIDVDPEWVVRGWRTITGVHNYEPRHLGEAVRFLDQNQDDLPWDAIFGHRYELADLPEAFQATPGGLREVIQLS